MKSVKKKLHLLEKKQTSLIKSQTKARHLVFNWIFFLSVFSLFFWHFFLLSWTATAPETNTSQLLRLEKIHNKVVLETSISNMAEIWQKGLYLPYVWRKNFWHLFCQIFHLPPKISSKIESVMFWKNYFWLRHW